MLLASHDDPQAAADYLLCGIEADLEALSALPDDLSHFRDRMADIADTLKTQANNTPRASHD